MNKNHNSIAVFPFIKTQEPIKIGRFNFKSFNDSGAVSEETKNIINEVKEMLYLFDDI